MKSMDGESIQTSVYSKGKWHTLEFDNPSEQTLLRFRPDLECLTNSSG